MKVVVMTLGCKVNKYESDSIIKDLKEKGHEVGDELAFADLYIINTCAVTAEAEKKSRQMISRCKKFNPNAKIFVCGCASQHNSKQFEMKGVDYVSGVAGKVKIAQYLEQKGKNIENLPEFYEEGVAQQQRLRAYIKIQDGCNNFCSYCIIPYLRGRSRSRNVESIIKEVEGLNEEVKEVVLTGINVTDFKINGKPGLLEVLKKLDIFNKRLRLSSMEDTLVGEEFIRGLSSLNNFCPHFHLSLQSGSESVLKRMNRKYTPEQFFNSVALIRKYFPLAGITTDVIVGYPGETEDEFNETYDFCKKVEFASLHIFPYSHREGTVASKLRDTPPSVKHARFCRLDQLKKTLHENFIKKNKTGKVLVEEKIGNFYVGYTENYIRCYIESDEDLINHIVSVEIVKPYQDGAIANIKNILE